MPPFSVPSKSVSIVLPPRSATLVAEADVLVVGGGPAGIGAALGAAAAGAEVMIAERYGFVGGNATAALVMPLMSFHTRRNSIDVPSERLFPHDHGPGEPVIRGVLEKLLTALTAAGGAIRPSRETGYVVPFDPELFKMVVLDLFDAAGVTFLLHAFASTVIDLGDRKRVVFETKSGPIAIDASTVVDATGDGDIAVGAGARYAIGRESDGHVQPMTLMFRMVEFAQPEFNAYVRENPSQWRGVYGLWDLVKEATEAGELQLAREDLLFFGTPHQGEVSVNSTRIGGALGTNVWDLTRAEWESRRQMRQIVRFLQQRVPGFANSYAVQSGTTVGVRETRRIVGEYTLDADDVLSARKFDDVVARGSYPMDIHNPTGPGTALTNLPPGESYDIPRRCLLPKDIDGVLVAGRCISSTHEAHSSCRVMPIAMATGHAAGAWAALAAVGNVGVRDVPTDRLQAELRRQDADLGDHC